MRISETEFDWWPSTTTRIFTGCGHMFITVCRDEGQIERVITHRKSVCKCDLTFFDALNRQTTFMTNRELEQAIEDLRGSDHPKEGHFCREYNVSVKSAMKQGRLAAYSCADAISKVLEREIQ
jgi:hypothetical protein